MLLSKATPFSHNRGLGETDSNFVRSYLFMWENTILRSNCFLQKEPRTQKIEWKSNSCVSNSDYPSLCLFQLVSNMFVTWVGFQSLNHSLICFFFIFSLSLFLCGLALTEFPDAGLEDERCPLVSGCDRTGGKCVCDSRRSCLASFTYPDKEACGRAAKAGKRGHPGGWVGPIPVASVWLCAAKCV